MKIHGLACFETMNGLRAFGSGRLGLADRHADLFEFRNPKLGGAEYLSTNVPTAFIRKFYYRNILAHLVGIVRKTRDNFGRAGFWGVAAMIDDDGPVDVEIMDRLVGLSDYADVSDKDEKVRLYGEILSQHDEFPEGSLSRYEGSDSILFSVGDGVLSEEVLGWSKSLMEVEPSNFSTVIVQLGPVANMTGRGLDEAAYRRIKEELMADSRSIQEQIDLENLEPHVRRFMERTDKIGVSRPGSVDPEFEEYLIALIRYVNNSLMRKRRR